MLVMAFFIFKCTSKNEEKSSGTDWLETEEFSYDEEIPQEQSPKVPPLAKILVKDITAIGISSSGRILGEYLIVKDKGNIYWGCNDSIVSAEMSFNHQLFQVTSYNGTKMSAILLNSEKEEEMYNSMLISEFKRGSTKRQAFKNVFASKFSY